MSKPVVAIPADIREIEGNVWQATPNQYVRAAVKGADVTVFLVPALEADVDFDGILDRVDGLLCQRLAHQCAPLALRQGSDRGGRPL